MKNKKGLSTIVTTLIIILLTLVAIGIIWAVVSNLLSKSSNTVDQTTRCLDVDVRATKVNETASQNYTITLRRSAGGTNEDIFAKVVIYNVNGASGVLDFTEGLSPIEASTQIFANTGVASATKVEVTPYYIDENNKEKICTVTTVLEL